MNGTERRSLRTKKLVQNLQKDDKYSRVLAVAGCVRWCVTMMNFTNSERVDMVMLYGVADRNSSLTRELWIERFPNRAIPCAGTFTSVVQHLRDHGTFEPQTHERGRERSAPRPPDDEDSFPVICERELHSLHRNIPALRRRDVDTATIKQHYYPEGGWGWLVCGAAFLAHLLTTGFQLAFGLLYLYTVKYLIKKNQDKDFYVMATG
ncbi:hypothetical protein Zmor_017609 [Zophobas morio]|uniref:DUF4817 domain-containing protein n=1 Tax=Zophobas morio TaxID=2755281 RepID=A0AA38MCQ7_9CUCU|nr:hypothetical protein Zmor_017609 [Zophobas morio]